MSRPIPVREPSKTISVYDWFDPHDLRHLRAYYKMQMTGLWPSRFIPDYVEMTTGWPTLLISKMADSWVEEKLRGVREVDPKRTSRGNLEPGV